MVRSRLATRARRAVAMRVDCAEVSISRAERETSPEVMGLIRLIAESRRVRTARSQRLKRVRQTMLEMMAAIMTRHHSPKVIPGTKAREMPNSAMHATNSHHICCVRPKLAIFIWRAMLTCRDGGPVTEHQGVHTSRFSVRSLVTDPTRADDRTDRMDRSDRSDD